MSQNFKTIGIIGGLGPMATVKFIEILNNIITDNDNIDYLIINDPSTPDRTSYLLNKNNKNPLPNILKMVDKLNKYNVDIIAMPCNTASYFYSEIEKNTNIRFINIVEETIKYINEQGIVKVGLLATSGTIKSKVYKHYCDKYGIEIYVPNNDDQKEVMHIIYNGVKANKDVSTESLYEISEQMIKNGAEKIILGCTELSVLYQDKKITKDYFIDSMQILANNVIKEIKMR